MKKLGTWEAVGIAICWIGVATVCYITKDGLISLIALICGYKLTKYIARPDL